MVHNHTEYMREYRKLNRDKINLQVKKRLISLKSENPIEYQRRRKKANIANEKYYQNNKQIIDEKRKENNWYFDKEKRVEIRKRYYTKNHAKALLASVKHRALNKGLLFDLTEEWYNYEWEKGCSMLGIPFDEPRMKTIWTAHIDRIIPEKGYTIDNCRLVCASYNQAKGNGTDEDVFRLAVLLLNNLKHRRTTDA